jgi:hypothetical protein
MKHKNAFLGAPLAGGLASAAFAAVHALAPVAAGGRPAIAR